MKSLLRVALTGAALSIATASALAGGYAVVELPVKSTWKKGSIASSPIAIDRHGRALVSVQGERHEDRTYLVGEMCSADGTSCWKLEPRDVNSAYGAASRGLDVLAGSITQAQGLPSIVIRRKKDGTVERLFEGTRPSGVNAAGTVVGILGDGVTAFRYDTALHPLQGLPGGLSAAVAINDSGTAVGHSRTAKDSPRAVQWDADGNVSLVGSELPELPNYLSRATAITPSGVVYGISTFTWITFPYHRAVRFEGDHEVDLGALMAPGGSPTDNESSVLAVNTKGQAVGWSTNMPKDRTQQAVIFDGVGNVTELATLIPQDMRKKYKLFSAVAINDAGQILVTGVRRQGGGVAALRLDPR